MASTATNKQPLLIDRPLHYIVDLKGKTVENTVVIDVGGSNSAALVVDCTTTDGAVLSEVYSLSRAITGSSPAAYQILLYLSTANDFLRASQCNFLGNFNAHTTAGTRTTYGAMPYVLNPVPGAGSLDSSDVIGTHFRALYIPKGYALWAAVQKKSASDTADEAPLIGCQGGFY